MIVAGVANITKFVQSSSKKFSSYVRYMDREEAIRNSQFNQYNVINYDSYQHYMDNPEKSGGLFGAVLDSYTVQQITEVKKLFRTAQENGSIMWQDVISFDNKWLTKHGAYNPVTGELDESVIRLGVRDGMSQMLKRENMDNSAVWTASIHYNTDNIHVHIATVEPKPTRPLQTFKNKKTNETYQARRGKRKLSSLDMMKQRVASHILDREENMTKLTSIIRNDLTLKNHSLQDNTDKELRYLYTKIYKALPSDKRLWKYNNQALNSVRPMIDDFITTFVEKYQYDSLEEVNSLIDDEIKTMKETYGEGSKQAGRYNDYRQTKIKEIHTRMGNQLLRNMNAYDKERYSLTAKKESSASTRKSLDKALHGLKKILNPKKNYHNQKVYEQLHELQNKEQGQHF